MDYTTKTLPWHLHNTTRVMRPGPHRSIRRTSVTQTRLDHRSLTFEVLSLSYPPLKWSPNDIRLMFVIVYRWKSRSLHSFMVCAGTAHISLLVCGPGVRVAWRHRDRSRGCTGDFERQRRCILSLFDSSWCCADLVYIYSP